MIKEVYESLLSKRNDIERQLQLLDQIKRDEILNKVKEKWKDYEPKQLQANFIAVDGGLWIKELRSGFVYVINAEVVKAEGLNVVPLDSSVNIGVLRPGNLAKERISLLMQLMELKLALKHGNETNYILIDGSIVKKVGDKKFLNKINILDDIEINEKIYSLEENNEELMYKYLIAENNIVTLRLIQEYRDKLLWISKNSKSTELFKENVSDISLLELFTNKSGYTEPLEKKISGKNLISDKASKILDGEVFYSAYLRLAEGQRILKVDMFNKNVERIIDVLSTISIKGYPYPLLKVHTDVKISRQDRERIQQLLNIRKRTTEWWPNQLF